MNEYEFEPVPGLPAELPQGEHILWQGAPDWKVVARRVFHLRIVAVYFLLLLALRAGTAISSGEGMDASAAMLTLTGLALCAGGLFVLYAWLIARSTIYTITNRRLVMRFGVAMPMTFNVPFKRVQAAAVKLYKDGSGDIPLTLDDTHRASYLILWPHVRPWQFRRPQPMLRSVPGAARAAEILADAASSELPDAQTEAVRPDRNSIDVDPSPAAV